MNNKNAHVLKTIESLRWRTFSNLKSLVDSIPPDHQTPILLLLVEEKLLQRRSSTLWNWSSFSLSDLCDELAARTSSGNRVLLTEELAALLPHLSNLKPFEQEPVLKALGKMANQDLLPELIHALELLRKKELMESAATIDQMKAEASWQELQTQVLGNFDEYTVKQVRRLLRAIEPLHKGSDYRRQLSERRRFMVRREVIELLRSEQALLVLSLRFLLSRFPGLQDDMILIVGGAVRGKNLRYVKHIANNDRDHNVRLSTKIILADLDDSFERELVPSENFTSVSHAVAYYDRLLFSRGTAYQGYTWLRDETIERVIHNAFHRSEEDFARFYAVQAAKREEGLTERFVSALEERFKAVPSAIANWSKTLTAGVVEVDFSYRDTQPQEKDWHCDIAFVLNCLIEGEFKKQQTILIQCKKMNLQTNGMFGNSWTIDVPQCYELIERSPFSYYFLFGPGVSSSTNTLVIPATTLTSLISGHDSSGQKTKNFSYLDLRSISRSLADFMLYDFIGCWVGDATEEVLQLATGGVNLPPLARHLITLTVTQRTRGQ